MLAMDRSIPHVRDIFAPYRGGSKSESRKTEVCVYDYSPGSRRRNQRDDSSSSNSSFSRDDLSSSSSPNDFIDTDHSDSTDTENQTKNERIRGRSPENRSSSRMDTRHSSNKKTNNNNRAGLSDNHSHLNHHNIRNDSHTRSASAERDGPGYSSKTLTDKDIRHLERHLSMKKTIRKQISRNLAQAFVEDPKALETDVVQQIPASNEKHSNYSFTLTRAKVAKSEPTFLDMLKDPRKETDSGHSSPSHQTSYDDIEHMEVDYDDAPHTRVDVKGYDKVPSPDFQDNRRNVHKDANPSPEHLKKGSFWKKFGFKGKARR